MVTEPLGGLLIQLGADLTVDALLVVVVPLELRIIKHGRIDHPIVEPAEGEALKSVELLSAAFAHLDAAQEVLYPDAILALGVVARLIRGDAMEPDRRGIIVGAEILRSLVAAEEVSHAVAGAVTIVLMLLPEVAVRQHVELIASRPLGEDRKLQVDVPLEYQRVVVTQLLRRLTIERDGAGDVGRPVVVLSTGVEEKGSLGLDLGTGVRHRMVVDEPRS